MEQIPGRPGGVAPIQSTNPGMDKEQPWRGRKRERERERERAPMAGNKQSAVFGGGFFLGFRVFGDIFGFQIGVTD